MNRRINGARAALLAICALGLMAAAGCKGRQGGEDVMARVNGRKILRSEVEKYYRNQTEGQPPTSNEQAQALRLGILREMIENEILAQRAEKLGLLATDEEVDSKLNEIRAPFTKEEFDQRLKERSITLDDFKRDLRRSITVEKVLNKEITSKINISDSDISNYYNQHKAEFNLIVPQYHLAQILVTTQPNPQVRNLKNDKAQNEAEAKKKVSMLHEPAGERRRLCHAGDELQRAPGYLGDGRRPGVHPGELTAGRQTGLRCDQPAEAGTVHSATAGGRERIAPGVRLPHHQADLEGAGGTARTERSAGAAGDSRTVARPAGAVAEERLLRVAAQQRFG